MNLPCIEEWNKWVRDLISHVDTISSKSEFPRYFADKQIAKDLKTSRIKPKEAEDIKQRIKVVTSIGDLKADEPQLVMEVRIFSSFHC